MSLSRIRLTRRFKEMRRLHGLTQEQFSEISGISYKYYQAIEAGRRIDLRFSTLERIAKAYGLGIHELLAPELPAAQPKKGKRGEKGNRT